jgi:hypothetical protein
MHSPFAVKRHHLKVFKLFARVGQHFFTIRNLQFAMGIFAERINEVFSARVNPVLAL